jgi:hypothetical protein
VISPIRTNAIIVTYLYTNGAIELNGLPISGQSVTNLPTLSYYRSFGFFGRSANIAGGLTYGVGTFEGEAGDVQRAAYRSGLLDSGVRFAVNLVGGPAMSAPEFAKWKQKILLGASLRVVGPTGQYDSGKLVNWGRNRWGFKPEFGYSQRFNRWVLDGAAGVWFFTTNQAFVVRDPPHTQKQGPLVSFEGHLSYDLKPFLWLALDGNYWVGGTTTVNGVANPLTEQKSSRLGATASIPLNKEQALKISYSNGVYGAFGAKYQALSIGWQYAWVDKPRKRASE